MSDALLEAVIAGDVDRLADLLASGVDPNKHFGSRYGTTPLQVAIGELQEFSEDDPGGSEPAGPIDAVVLLLRHGADANGWDERHRYTPLLSAVLDNQIEAVRLLLAAGADPNVQDDEGRAPLRFCAEKGYLEMARLLLLCGATKTIHEGAGPTGMNALGFAATRLHVDMVRLLLAHGADPSIGDGDDMTTFRRLRLTVELGRVPEDPAAQERLREIRRLLGGPSA